MSIIEKALDKALGRNEEESPEAAEHRIAPEAPAPAEAEHEREFEVEVEETHEVSETVQLAAPADDIPPPAQEPAPGVELPSEGPVHALDWEMLKSHGCVTAKQEGLFATYQSIGSPVLANAFPGSRAGIQRGNLVLVTSSRAGEGKTFTALNVALSLALADSEMKLLLIDADTEKASLSRLLGIADQSGLSELVESKNQRLQDLALRTDLPGLRILPAGQGMQKGRALLAGSGIMKFAKELAKLHPGLLVIFDGPPLLDVAETASLAMQVGQVLVVVEVEMTPQVVVREALAKLEFCNVVGCVLNKTSQPETSSSDSLAFGYGLYQPEFADN